ncbi:MAG: hypothetical protein ABI895_20110 [Deltaproteobacteria bacterium]
MQETKPDTDTPADAGTSLDWEAQPLLHFTVLGLANLLDPSALGSLSLSYEASANTRIAAGGYLPIGAAPRASPGVLVRSEYGLYPAFGFVELRVQL